MTEPTTFTTGGATVTLDTPSAQIVKAAAKSFDVTDDRGRTITLKKPSPLANLDFAKAAGSGSGGEVNQIYLAEIFHLKFVAAIDGNPVVTPGSEGELRALYGRLGDEGNEAAQAGVFANFMNEAPSTGDVKNS
ncbi:hypothetical protein [Sphingomonas sp. 10B4]|uniref:hypothetical protein n=1 Tax=Sphingomonas sp. 10B4 TaxID=3048575 RepID=UPI002AB5D809|nr:hypothetical protein [Sphingomonas sp. 10B4]MDY7525487.1 hypothetical protein [Sphingomonas sp. 10B4]MEB0281431.1 hypothetical protein [Sphingomonas sp. 10B4]